MNKKMEEKKVIHKAKWLVDLLKEANGMMDEKKLASILENRGRACIAPAYIKKAKDASRNAKDTNEFLEKLGKAIPMFKKEGEKAYMVYQRCYCHKVKGFEGTIPSSYCNCSVGWVKEMFEQALGRPIRVNLESSVLRGDKECRLRIFL